MAGRSPIYLVLDTSASMQGEPIEKVWRVVRALVASLRAEPMANERVYLAVITFNDRAQQDVPLTDLLSFREPVIDAEGAAALGEALRLLQECMDREVEKKTETQKGDFKPLVLLMTAGKPTDDYQPEAEKLKQKRCCTIIACTPGEYADGKPHLKLITDIVIKLDDCLSDLQNPLKSLFGVSEKTERHEREPVHLPSPPPEIHIV